MHQQNGRAEQLIRMLMDKGEAMHHEACLPDSWWEFSLEHAAHVYNRTPMHHIEWQTPYEVINGVPPRINYLCVFG